MIFKSELIERILAGEKTVTRRPVKGECAYAVGGVYALQPGMGRVTVGRIAVRSVTEIHLAEIDDDDAAKEGFASADEFAAYWKKLYDGVFDPDMKVWRIEFELVEATHHVCRSCAGAGAIANGRIPATEPDTLTAEEAKGLLAAAAFGTPTPVPPELKSASRKLNAIVAEAIAADTTERKYTTK